MQKHGQSGTLAGGVDFPEMRPATGGRIAPRLARLGYKLLGPRAKDLDIHHRLTDHPILQEIIVVPAAVLIVLDILAIRVEEQNVHFGRKRIAESAAAALNE
ncbi:MAG: hypothetical protein ACYS9C_02455 [Planctomycetota bacterium]